MSQTTLSILIHAFGMSFGLFLVAQYRLWKARRREIRMEFNPKTGVYEPDLTLRKWERRAKIALVTFIVVNGVIGTAYIMTVDTASLSR